MKDIVYVCSLLLALIFVSCEKQVASFPDNEVAEILLQENPDSLAVLLEEKTDPTTLPDSLKAEYGWWIARLHYRQGRSMMNDSLIHHTLDYFREHASPRLPYAYVLAGMQKNWAGNVPEEEIRYMEEGWNIARSRRDTAWAIDVGTILAHAYFVSNDARSAVNVDNEILRYTEKDPGKRLHILYTAGCCYAQLGETDSMNICLEEAIRLSRELEDRSELYITRNYIDALNSIGRSEEAAPLLEQFCERFPAATFQDSLAVEFAHICLWLNTGRMDSVRSALERLKQYEKKSVRDEYRNKYRVSFVYISQLLRTAYDVKSGRPVDLVGIYGISEMVADWEASQMGIERERALTQSRLERKNLLLKIKEEQGRQLILYLLLSTGFVIAVLVWLYQRKLLKKERYLQQVKEQIRLHRIALNENEQLIRRNEETIQDLSVRLDEQEELDDRLHDRQLELDRIQNENKALLDEKRRLEQELGRFMQAVPEKGVEMEAYERATEQSLIFMSCAKRLSALLIGLDERLQRLQRGEFKHLADVEWPSVYEALDQLFDGYTQRLRRNYPLLTEEDIQCCCLIKLQLSTSAIARLYGIAPSSVTKRKQRIKERMNQAKPGLIGKEQLVDVYLWGY